MDGSGWIKNRLITIKLLVDTSLKETVLEYCSEENIKPVDAHTLLVDFPFTLDDMGYSVLLSFGNKCTCLEPDEVRGELKKRIKDMLDLYV